MGDRDLLEIVPTRAMLLQKGKVSDFKVTVFESHKPTGKKTSRLEKHPEGTPKQNPNEFDIKKARHEVLNFGLSGFGSKDKKAAEIAMAVKLGAIPPKNVYKNYKELLAEKKARKDQEESEKKMLQLGKNQTGAASVRFKGKTGKRKKDGEISQNYGIVKPKIFSKKKKRK